MKKILFLILLIFMMGSLWAQTKHNATITNKVVTVNPLDWKLTGSSTESGGYLSDTIKWNALTKEVFDNGAVMVYVLGTSGGGWHLLPHSYYSDAGEIEVNFNYHEGYLEIRMRPLVKAESKFPTERLPSYKYKIVVISE